MNSQMTHFYSPTVKELLQLPIFHNCKLIAGSGGLDHLVTGTNQTDDANYLSWVSAGELMISTLSSICNDPLQMKAYIPNLASKNLSGFCIKAHNYLNGIVPPYMIQQANELNFPLIELPPDAQFSLINTAIADELTNRRTMMLRNTLQVNQMLTQTITEGANLDKIAQTISALSEGSILIVDTINDLHSLYLRESDEEELKNLPEPMKLNIIISQAEHFELKSGQSSYGYLYVYKPNSKAKIPPELMRQILAAVPLVITREQSLRQSSSSMFASFLFHLLTDPIRDEQEETARAAEFGLTLQDNHMLLHLRFLGSSNHVDYSHSFQSTLLLGRLRSTFTKLSLNVHIVDYNRKLVILLSAPSKVDSFQNVRSYLPDLFRSFDMEYPNLKLVCGSSCIHAGLNGLIQANKEAEMSLKTSIALSKIFVCYEELGLMRLIHAADPDAECISFISETIGPLIENDKAKHSDLLRTLDAYFEYAGNAKLISENLFTHYNTISYRLRNIQDLTHKDLHKRNDRFQLQIALDLYKHYYAL